MEMMMTNCRGRQTWGGRERCGDITCSRCYPESEGTQRIRLCPTCGEPAHATETDDNNRHRECQIVEEVWPAGLVECVHCSGKRIAELLEKLCEEDS